ncbi:MAG TPA: hypothetical protein VD902_21285, partial [Symbiobacteriaceae bacterium]|nr:hypothetical protein [Symbiobacteriaceae bacterium]
MSNLHRLQWVDAQIRAGQYPNAGDLAAAFEISRRQALRDFEYLRDSLGAPLAYSAAHRGYHYTCESFTLPGAYVTGAQRSMLSSLASYYSEVARQDSRFGAAYADMAGLLRRLGAGAGDVAAGDGARVFLRRPFRALLHLPGEPGAALRPFWRGGSAYEFDDPAAFLNAILATGASCRVDWPGWLRERLRQQLQDLLQAQDDMTRHVTPPLVSWGHQEIPARRYQEMNATRKVLEARFTGSWNSYAGAVHGVLKAAGMYDGDFTRLMGMTGMAFHLIMHEECCISSATVYNWQEEHSASLDRLGVYAETFGAMPDQITYETAIRRAVANIKGAVDRGVGAILWGVDTGEFGVVYGYDD